MPVTMNAGTAGTALDRCCWCDVAGTTSIVGESSLEGSAFVVLSDHSGRCGQASLTLVLRKHVRTLAELPLPEMAEVLAGLSKASAAVRGLSGADRVEIQTDLDGHNGKQQHLHFRVEARN